ncbi:MAG: hypothetical protein KDI36_12285, partial [Pseudomonadales bacterium]|nr:hypothetical protein [Pseudomonadales bacterium]
MSGIIDLRYVRFTVEDLEKQQQFLEDFGLTTTLRDGLLIGKGTDGYPYAYVATLGPSAFLGMGFEAESIEELERIAAIDGVPVAEITDLPGGGKRARMTDPNGFSVDVVYGSEVSAAAKLTNRSPFNTGNGTDRLGTRVILTEQKNIVRRLGHCVINAIDFRTTEAWYKARIGFITSD